MGNDGVLLFSHKQVLQAVCSSSGDASTRGAAVRHLQTLLAQASAKSSGKIRETVTELIEAVWAIQSSITPVSHSRVFILKYPRHSSVWRVYCGKKEHKIMLCVFWFDGLTRVDQLPRSYARQRMSPDPNATLDDIGAGRKQAKLLFEPRLVRGTTMYCNWTVA